LAPFGTKKEPRLYSAREDSHVGYSALTRINLTTNQDH